MADYVWFVSGLDEIPFRFWPFFSLPQLQCETTCCLLLLLLLLLQIISLQSLPSARAPYPILSAASERASE
jgi:hypothetical protein